MNGLDGVNDFGEGVNNLVEVICFGEDFIGLVGVICLVEGVNGSLVGLLIFLGVVVGLIIVKLCGVEVLVEVDCFGVEDRSGFLEVIVCVNFECSVFWIWERWVWIVFINLFLGNVEDL